MINIAELGTKAASRSPGAPALIDPHLSITRTFGELDQRTLQLAAALATEARVAPGDRVAALSRNCIELLELYLASARAGALLFPLNWRFSASQVQEALLDAAPKVVFYEAEFRAIVEEVRGAVDTTFVEWVPGSPSAYEELLDRAAARDLAPGALPDPGALLHQPFLAVSTGGTTGIPKSAVHTHFTYGACAINYQAAARITETDVYMMLGQLFHVVGYMPLAYLAMGRPVVITNFDAGETLDIVRAEGVTGLFAIATMLPRLVNELRSSGLEVPTVRQVEYGGAPMGEEVIRDAADLFGADLVQAWGMTELGPGTYLGPEAHRRAFSGERPELLRSCGKETLLGTVAILDEDGRPVPQDQKTMGEVCHRGPGNMVGYWNKPDETADMLRDGWVHSGDGGVWDEEGFVYIVDRIKSMIISGGENIFPSEIERALGNHPDVAEAVVVGAPHPEWGEVVKAVVVRRPGTDLDADAVTRYVEDTLGSYKKPRLVQFLDQLPMTPTGKVDRKVLRES